MMRRTYTTALILEEGMSAIPVPFDPKAAFGKVRAPVCVTVNGYTYRSTIAVMGGPPFVPLRRSHREAAGLLGTETLEVTLELDTEPRDVEPPSDLREALQAVPRGWERWETMSYTHRREHVEAIEAARKPETRARRISRAVEAVVAQAPGSR